MEKNAQCKKDLDVKERHCKIKETITQRREIISACNVNETKTRTWWENLTNKKTEYGVIEKITSNL